MFLLPHSVSGYTLQRKLGTGGVAESYLGTHDAAGGRQVVVRRVLPFVLRDAARLASIEARIRDLLGVRHPFLVHVVDHVVEADEHFVVEEYVNGVTLEQVLNWCRQSGHVVPPNVFLNIATQICNGLEALHGRSGKGSSAEHVLHLALKPSAIFLSNEGKVLVGSYGLTRSPTSYPQGGVSGPVPARMEYLSPEQTHPDQKLGPASDVFALGALLYELLTLESLFRAESNLQTIHRVRRAEVTSSLLKVKERMPGLDKVLFRALSLNPRHRYQRAFVLREDLRGLMAGYSFATIGEDTRTFLQPILAGASAPGAAGYVVGLDDAPESPMGADAFSDSPATRIDPDPMSTAAHAASALAERVANERAIESAPENTERTDIHPEGDLTPLPFTPPPSPTAAPTWTPDADPPSSEEPAPGGGRASKRKKKELALAAAAPAPLAVPEPPPRVDPPFRASPPTLAPALSPFSAPPGPSPLGAPLPPATSSPTLSPEAGLPSPSELGTAAFAMPAPAPVHPEPEPETLLAIPAAVVSPPPAPEPAPAAPKPSAADPLPGRSVPPPGGARPLLGRPVPPPSFAAAPRPPAHAPPPPPADSLYDAPPPSRGPLFATVTMLAVGAVLLCSGGLYWAYGTWSHIQSVEGTNLADAAPPPVPAAAAPSAAPPKIEPVTDDPASVLAAGGVNPGPNPAPEPVKPPEAVKAPEPAKPPEVVKAPEPVKAPPAPKAEVAPAPTKATAPPPKPAPVVAKAAPLPAAKTPPPPKPKPEPEPAKVVAKVTPPPKPPEPAKPAPVKTAPAAKVSKGAPPPVVADASLTVLESSTSTALDSFVRDARAGRLSSTDVASLESTGATDPQYTRSRALLMMNAQKKGDDAAAHRYLDQAMTLPENQYNPVFLADYARWHVNRGEYDRALDRAEKAERYWARLPSELVFSKKAEIYEIEAAAWQGKFYKSGEDLELLENAVRGWEKVRAHAATKDRSDLVQRADTELAKLNDIRARLQ